MYVSLPDDPVVVTTRQRISYSAGFSLLESFGCGGAALAAYQGTSPRVTPRATVSG